MRFKEIQEGTRCWKGYEKKGMKTMFGKRVPNCVKREDIETEAAGSGGGALGGAIGQLAQGAIEKIGGVAGDYIDKYVKYRQNRLPNEKAKLQKGLSQLAKQLTPAQKRLMKARLDQINDILDKQKAKQQPKPLTPKDFAKYDRRVRVKAPTRQS